MDSCRDGWNQIFVHEAMYRFFEIDEVHKLMMDEIYEIGWFTVKFEYAPPRGVPRKTCSENMQQIYRRTPMSKCDFNKVATLLKLQLY